MSKEVVLDFGRVFGSHITCESQIVYKLQKVVAESNILILPEPIPVQAPNKVISELPDTPSRMKHILHV